MMTRQTVLLVALGAMVLSPVAGFTTGSILPCLGKRLHMCRGLRMAADACSNDQDTVASRRSTQEGGVFYNRRAALLLGTAGVLAGGFQSQTSAAVQDSAAGAPITVLGATGRNTGSECVAALVRENHPARLLVRSPRDLPFDTSKVVVTIGDVTKPKTLTNVIKGSKAVIYAVGAKKLAPGAESSGDLYSEIEEQGLMNVAKECIKHRVPRLIVLGSGCSKCQKGSRFASSKACNQCTSKIAGEEGVRELYEQAGIKDISYTIARAGILLQSDRRGPADIELNQGNDKTGLISRADMADLLVAIAKDDTDSARSVTFEAYYRDTTQPVDFMASIAKCKEGGKTTAECFFGEKYATKEPVSLQQLLDDNSPADTVFETGSEQKGSTYPELIKGLLKDGQLPAPSSAPVPNILDFGFQSG